MVDDHVCCLICSEGYIKEVNKRDEVVSGSKGKRRIEAEVF